MNILCIALFTVNVPSILRLSLVKLISQSENKICSHFPAKFHNQYEDPNFTGSFYLVTSKEMNFASEYDTAYSTWNSAWMVYVTVRLTNTIKI